MKKQWKQDYQMYRILSNQFERCANFPQLNISHKDYQNVLSICQQYRIAIGHIQSRWPSIFKPDNGDVLAWRQWHKKMTGTTRTSKGVLLECNQSFLVYDMEGNLL